MKREISNEHFHTIHASFFLFGLTIATLITLLFFNQYSQLCISLILGFAFGLLTLYYSTRFYKVSFDSDFLYISRFGRSQNISLEKVDEIRPNVIPFRIFYLNAYIITIIYRENDLKKKIKFISKGAFRNVGSVDGIPHLDKLKQYVHDKKYGK